VQRLTASGPEPLVSQEWVPRGQGSCRIRMSPSGAVPIPVADAYVVQGGLSRPSPPRN